jgi:hypothetical protein
MRMMLASGRGLLGGWLIAMAIPLLIDPRAISGWSATGLHDNIRIGLAAVEVLGGALFAFEGSSVAGLVLLLAAFLAAAAIHLYHGDKPWQLAVYSTTGMLLLYFTRRVHRPKIK